LVLPDLLVKSNLYRKVSAKLTTPYNVMTTFYFRRSVEKAFQLDEYPTGLSLRLNRPIEGNAPFIVMAVDDVMYIVNTVIQKSMSTSQRDVIASVIPTIGRVLGSDFVGMIQRKMRDESYPKPNVQGNFPPEDKIIQFIVLINSLDMANEYLSRIIGSRIVSAEGRSNSITLHESVKDSFPFDKDATFVANSLHSLETSFVSKSSELLNEGIQVLLTQVVKLRLRPILSETFRDADYAMDEDDVAEMAQQNDENEDDVLDQVRRRFEHGWDLLMKPIARIMTPGTFSTLLDIATRYLSKILEKRILSYAGKASPFGVVRIERDYTGIVNIVSKGDYRVREVFNKVIQLLMVANMEDDEWEELINDESAIEWVLTEEERQKARGLLKA
jgi:Ca2+-transporting ATPase